MSPTEYGPWKAWMVSCRRDPPTQTRDGVKARPNATLLLDDRSDGRGLPGDCEATGQARQARAPPAPAARPIHPNLSTASRFPLADFPMFPVPLFQLAQAPFSLSFFVLVYLTFA